MEFGHLPEAERMEAARQEAVQEARRTLRSGYRAALAGEAVLLF